MRSLRHEFYNCVRGDVYRIVPLGDIHIGAAACDEAKLKRTVADIAADSNCFWIGMGDYCEFITKSDSKRYDPLTMADWITLADTVDLARAQIDRFIKLISPIASKCLGIIEGNHEEKIKKYSENNVCLSIINAIKKEAVWGDDKRLMLGVNGYIKLMFYRADENNRQHSDRINIYAMHGYGGGGLAGGRALNLQRQLLTHPDADIVLFGHVHTANVQPEAVVLTDRAGNVYNHNIYGALTGTFLRSYVNQGEDTYPEKGGKLPIAIVGNEIEIRPHTENNERRITLKVYGC